MNRAQARRTGAFTGAVTLWCVLAAGWFAPAVVTARIRLVGDILDPWQTLWGLRAWSAAVTQGASPFVSRSLWYPDGVPLWFQSWDIPSALAATALQPFFDIITIYNFLLALTFVLSAWTFALLCRELWGGRLASVLAGCLYSFSTWHVAHAQMQLHLASMEWSPLFLLGLIKTLRYGRSRDVLLAGAGLSVAFFASIYHLLFCAIAGLVLLLTGALGTSREILTRSTVVRLAGVATVFGALAGWLLFGMFRSYVSEPYIGSHDAVRFSADLQSFLIPNAVNRWSAFFPVVKQWTGMDWESAGYVGYVTTGLAAVAAWRSKPARPYCILALVGAVLALGPRLHVGGAVYPGLTLPDAWLEFLIPPLRFSGIPARYTWLTLFGLTVAAGATLSALCRRGRVGSAAAVLLTALALIEVWPRPFVTSFWPTPPILQTWASDRGDWAVLDGTLWSRALWHQMQHQHPIIAGYATRVPDRLWQKVKSEPAVVQFFGPPLGRYEAASIPPERTRQVLREWHVRYVIVDDARTAIPEALHLRDVYRGDGIAAYEVPEDTPRTDEVEASLQ